MEYLRVQLRKVFAGALDAGTMPALLDRVIAESAQPGDELFVELIEVLDNPAALSREQRLLIREFLLCWPENARAAHVLRHFPSPTEYLQQDLLMKVRELFPAAPFTGPVTVCDCEECSGIQRELSGKAWTEMPEWMHEDTAPYTLMSPEAKSAFFPGLLRRALELGIRDDNDIFWRLRGDLVGMFHDEHSQRHYLGVVRQLTPEQRILLRDVVLAFQTVDKHYRYYEEFEAALQNIELANSN